MLIKPTFNWIKAHNGQEGNERADELAKIGAVKGHFYQLDAPFSFAKRIITQQMIDKWNLEWTNAVNGGWTRKIFPIIEHRHKAKFFRPDFISTQFVSAHGKFGSYLKRKTIRITAECPCGAEQDAEHLLLYCPAFAAYRQIDTDPLTIMKMYQQLHSKLTFKKFIQYIHKTLIFWEQGSN